MITTLGYSKAHIAILDDNEKVIKVHTIEGDGKGGTVSAKIGGLETPTQSIDASDGTYYTSASGVGKPTLEMEVVELTDEQRADFFGMKFENGVLSHGKKTRPPYVAIMFETEGMQNNTIYPALLKGKLSTDGMELQTGTADKGKDVQTISFSGSFETRGADGEAFLVGNTANKDFELETFKARVFPEAPAQTTEGA